jgi:hypothetical protein
LLPLLALSSTNCTARPFYVCAGNYYLYENEIEKTTMLGMVPKPDNTISRKAKNLDQTQMDTTAKVFMFLPLTNAVHMDMLHAYTKVRSGFFVAYVLYRASSLKYYCV